MHPLVYDLSKLKDSEIESKILDLSKKYWQSSNPSVRDQISMLLDSYNEELRTRRSKLWQQQQENNDKGLDTLINVN